MATAMTDYPRAYRAPNIAPPSAAAEYTFYGRRVRSEVVLPLRPDTTRTGRVDWSITLAPAGQTPRLDAPVIAGLPCGCARHQGRWVTLVRRGPGGTWFWYDDAGTCHASPDARSVIVYPAADGDVRALGLILVGQIATFVTQQLGTPCLHAGAVQVGPGGIVFLGTGGRGKSTMTAYFLSRGAELLADDVLPLSFGGEQIAGLPSVPTMKLWQETADQALRLTHALPALSAFSAKKLFALENRFAFARAAVPLRAIFVLNRYDASPGQADVTLEKLSPAAAVASLLAQTSARAYLHRTEMAALLPLYARLTAQAPVLVLSYPSGFAHQETVYERVMAELEKL